MRFSSSINHSESGIVIFASSAEPGGVRYSRSDGEEEEKKAPSS